MANSFRTNKAWREGGPEGKTILVKSGILTIDTTAEGGGAVGDFPPPMFGLHKFYGVGSIVGGALATSIPNRAYGTGITPDGKSIIVLNYSNTSFIDLPNGVYRLLVKGT